MKMNIKFIYITLFTIFYITISTHILSNYKQEDTSKTLIDLVESQIQENDKIYFSEFGKIWKTEKFELYFSPYKDSTVNGIIQISMITSDDFAQALDTIIAHATTYSLPFSLMINPEKCPQEFDQILKIKGFAHERFDVMIYNFHDSQFNYTSKENINLIDKNEIESWLNISNKVFNEYDREFTRAYARFMEKTIDNNNQAIEYYAGYIDSKIVSIGSIFLYPTFGYIANIATDFEYQKNGVATNILYALLASAQQKGLEHVFLLTNTAAKLYAKIGFKKTFEVDCYTFNNNYQEIKPEPDDL